MDLYSGLPYWIAKNPLDNYFNPLRENYTADVVIIGSGITGALVAHALCSIGLKCAVVDKRTLTTGSSVASTALLQYEIDVPLCKMAEQLGETKAVKAFESCLQSISDIEKLFENIGYNPDFKRVPSIFYASNPKGHRLIKKEYAIRQRHNLPVTYLTKKGLYDKYGIKAPGALENQVSGQLDAYKAAVYLLHYNRQHNGLKIFTHTEVTDWKENQQYYELFTSSGNIMKSRYLVIAAGFEAGSFLPEPVMKLTSTYAIISQPVEEKYLWKNQALIWETREPYLYIRTDGNNRIIVGGEDEEFKNSVLRDKLIRKKVGILEKKIRKLFPGIPFQTDMAWCGTFSSTDDGLPFIGALPGKERMLYALGYGGNGITFSMIASQVIRNKLSGVFDEREKIFGFDRKNK